MSSSPILVDRVPELLTRTEPLSPSLLASLAVGPDPTIVELPAGTELHSLVASHVMKHAGAARSFGMRVGSGNSRCCDGSDSEDDDDAQSRVATKVLGLGTFEFTFESAKIFAVHHTLGEVVGTNCSASLMRTLVLVSDADISALVRFCDHLIAAADACTGNVFNIFRWHVQHQYWHKAETAQARPVESVVLPAELKSKLVDDIADFAAPATKQWYVQHGIPYKRSYLLHGSPGAGKTSIIQALAGRFKRNVCYFSSLSHPEMTDDGLKSAVQRVPAKSILVFEDIDAVFTGGRGKKDGDKSAVTFSGLLNALDGVGGSSGQLFVLTTNHRERLDPALIRNGRVDMHVHFSDATSEQMRMLFAQFYPKAEPALAAAFEEALTAELGERTVSMAQLQAYFIQMRKRPAEAAAAEVKKVMEEVVTRMIREDEGAASDGKTQPGEEAAAEEAAAVAGEEKKEPQKAAAAAQPSKEVHVHVHVGS